MNGLQLSEAINYFDGKSYSTANALRVLEMHIHLSCCLQCLMKLTGICNKINFRFDSYSFICVLSYLLSQKGK